MARSAPECKVDILPKIACAPTSAKAMSAKSICQEGRFAQTMTKSWRAAPIITHIGGGVKSFLQLFQIFSKQRVYPARHPSIVAHFDAFVNPSMQKNTRFCGYLLRNKCRLIFRLFGDLLSQDCLRNLCLL